MKLLVDERDMKFVLYEQLRIEELCKSPLYADFSQETFDLILEQAGKLAERAFYPSNKKGDEQGCRFENGQVKVPDSFHEPYRLYREGGWLAMSDPPEVGGQGLPVVLSLRLHRNAWRGQLVAPHVLRADPRGCASSPEVRDPGASGALHAKSFLRRLDRDHVPYGIRTPGATLEV